jgi:hypothetical protein
MLSRFAQRVSIPTPLRAVSRFLSAAPSASASASAPATLVEAAKTRLANAPLTASLAASAAASASAASAPAAAEALWAAAQLCVVDAEVVNTLAKAAAKVAPSFDAVSCGAAAWGAASLRVSDASFWSALSAAASRVAVTGVTVAVAKQLLAAHYLTAGKSGEGGGTTTPFLSTAGLSACTAALPAPTATLPATAIELKGVLAELGYESKRILGLGGLVEVALLVGATGLGPTAIEMDGPSAFLGVAGPRGSLQTGETRARTRLLKEALGISVVRVPFWQWAALSSNADRLRYLAARIQGSPQELVFEKSSP